MRTASPGGDAKRRMIQPRGSPTAPSTSRSRSQTALAVTESITRDFTREVTARSSTIPSSTTTAPRSSHHAKTRRRNFNAATPVSYVGQANARGIISADSAEAHRPVGAALQEPDQRVPGGLRGCQHPDGSSESTAPATAAGVRRVRLLRSEVMTAMKVFRPQRQHTQAARAGARRRPSSSASYGQHVRTDEHGRVKVQFHWDREGRSNEDSSCWIRVSQAGPRARAGAAHLPAADRPGGHRRFP